MSSDTIWQVITGTVIIGIVMLLVKPGSPGPAAVKAVSESLASLVRTATGYNSQ